MARRGYVPYSLDDGDDDDDELWGSQPTSHGATPRSTRHALDEFALDNLKPPTLAFDQPLTGATRPRDLFLDDGGGALVRDDGVPRTPLSFGTSSAPREAFPGGGDSFLSMGEGDDDGQAVYLPAMESKLVDESDVDLRYSEVIQSFVGGNVDGDAMIDRFIELSRERVTGIEDLLKKSVARLHPSDVAQLRSQRDGAIGERNTWLLMGALRRSELSRQRFIQLQRYSEEDQARMSERQIVEHTIMEDEELHQVNVLVGWLEQVAREDRAGQEELRCMRANADASWWNTADDALRRRRADAPSTPAGSVGDARSVGGASSVLDRLDPDAPIRQHKALHVDDERSEEDVLRGVWTLLRSGRRADAADYCRSCKQHWRATTLDAMVLHDAGLSGDARGPSWTLDPANQQLHDDDAGDAHGNPFRATYKHACHRLATCDEYSHAERAVYATLCGYLPAMLPMCQSWADHLWARLRCVRDCRVDGALEHHPSAHRLAEDGFADAPPAQRFPVPVQPVTLSEVFRELSTSESAPVRFAAENTFHDVQTHLALRSEAQLLHKMKEWVCADHPSAAAASAEHHQQHLEKPLTSARTFSPLVRFSAHLAIVCEALGGGWLPRSSVVDRDAVVDAYVQRVIERDHSSAMEMVALYAKLLPDQWRMGENVRVRRVAEYLATIHDAQDKQRFCRLASEMGLDVPRITKYLVERITTEHHGDGGAGAGVAGSAADAGVSGIMLSSAEVEVEEDGSSTSAGRLLMEDARKIRAIEWLTLDTGEPSQAVEALAQSNALARQFLRGGKQSAAEALFKALPIDLIDRALACGADEEAVREHQAHKALLSAVADHAEWFQCYSNEPEEPVKPTSRAAHQKILYQTAMNKYRQDSENWVRQHTLLLDRAVESLQDVLRFPGGWMMVDGTVMMMGGGGGGEDDGGNKRLFEMRQLRDRYVPRMYSLMHHVLSRTGQLDKCIALAELVVEERTKHYQCFSKSDLGQLLEMICTTCVKKMKSTCERASNEDPLEFLDYQLG